METLHCWQLLIRLAITAVCVVVCTIELLSSLKVVKSPLNKFMLMWILYRSKCQWNDSKASRRCEVRGPFMLTDKEHVRCMWWGNEGWTHEEQVMKCNEGMKGEGNTDWWRASEVNVMKEWRVKTIRTDEEQGNINSYATSVVPSFMHLRVMNVMPLREVKIIPREGN